MQSVRSQPCRVRPVCNMSADRDPASEDTQTVTAGGAPPITRPAGGLSIGQVLGGRYAISAELGRGGAGAVYLAADELARVQVALKVLDTPDWLGADVGGQLFRELRFGRSLQDANVCRIHDVFEVDGRCFLTMEYASSGTLRATLLERGGNRSVDEKLADARAAIAGLAAIHRAGLVHRDLKPENILRAGDGRLLVSDFGITRALAQTTITTRVAGTPGYLSPETLRGLEPSQAADVWSLGVVLHEILTGRRPRWTAGGWRVQLPRHTADRREEALARVCRACLQDQPQHRPADGGAVQTLMERELRRFHLHPWLRRSLRAAAVVGALAVAAGVTQGLRARSAIRPCDGDGQEVCRLAGGVCERWPDASEHCRWPQLRASQCGLGAAQPLDPPNQGNWTTVSRPGAGEGPAACLADVRNLCTVAEWLRCRYFGAISCENPDSRMCRWRSEESDCNGHADKRCWGIWTAAAHAQGSPRNGVPRNREGSCLSELTNLTGKACP